MAPESSLHFQLHGRLKIKQVTYRCLCVNLKVSIFHLFPSHRTYAMIFSSDQPTLNVAIFFARFVNNRVIKKDVNGFPRFFSLFVSFVAHHSLVSASFRFIVYVVFCFPTCMLPHLQRHTRIIKK